MIRRINSMIVRICDFDTNYFKPFFYLRRRTTQSSISCLDLRFENNELVYACHLTFLFKNFECHPLYKQPFGHASLC